MQLRVLAVVGLHVVAATCVHQTAWATCAYRSILLPGLESNVPTNTHIWSLPLGDGYGDTNAEPPVLEDCAGNVVALTTSEISIDPPPHATQGTLTVYTPVTPLQPNTKYCSKGGTPWFETGTTTLSTAPAAPVIGQPVVTANELWDSTIWPAFFASFRELSMPATGLYLLNRSGEASFDAPTLTGTVQDASYSQGQTEFKLENLNACGGNWPDAALGTSTTVALGYLDLAGNFSGWSNTVPVTAPNTWTDATVTQPAVGGAAGTGGMPGTAGSTSKATAGASNDEEASTSEANSSHDATAGGSGCSWTGQEPSRASAWFILGLGSLWHLVRRRKRCGYNVGVR